MIDRLTNRWRLMDENLDCLAPNLPQCWAGLPATALHENLFNINKQKCI
ncbi:MAG: hypothetical protein OEL53_18085 [Rhodospirillales bacterium]|nr:hypothetical protein [Rhodospirillales bacterium]